MAIVKAINVNKADREKFLASLSYVSNPEKLRNRNQEKKAEKFKMQSLVNRMLHGKGTCKRHFKQYVVSLEMKWPKRRDKAEECEEALQRVLHNCQIYFMEQGYMVEAWIHCNTSHPHFHLLLDTCNALSGKQFSKSSLELQDFKNFVSSQLLKAGLNEQVLTNIKEISEEEMLLQGEQNENGNYWDAEDDQMLPDVFDYSGVEFLEISDWNNGTMEQLKESIPLGIIHEISGAKTIEGHELCHIVGNMKCHKGREMVRLISETETRQGREMVRLVSETERRQGREMVRLVSEMERGQGRKMVRYV